MRFGRFTALGTLAIANRFLPFDEDGNPADLPQDQRLLPTRLRELNALVDHVVEYRYLTCFFWKMKDLVPRSIYADFSKLTIRVDPSSELFKQFPCDLVYLGGSVAEDVVADFWCGLAEANAPPHESLTVHLEGMINEDDEAEDAALRIEELIYRDVGGE